MQGVETMKELELDTASSQCLIDGRYHHIAHTCGHLPEDRDAILKKRNSDQEDSDTGAHRGSIVVGVLVAEDEVVQPSHQRKLDDIGMGAMAQDPFGEVLVVD